jgi:hypothetical protein
VIDTTDIEGFVKQAIDRVMGLEDGAGYKPISQKEREALEAEIRGFLEGGK